MRTTMEIITGGRGVLGVADKFARLNNMIERKESYEDKLGELILNKSKNIFTRISVAFQKLHFGSLIGRECKKLDDAGINTYEKENRVKKECKIAAENKTVGLRNAYKISVLTKQGFKKMQDQVKLSEEILAVLTIGAKKVS